MSDQEKVDNYLRKVKPLVESATAKELFENTAELANDPELPKKVERDPAAIPCL
jgi:hypothetical protein